MVPSDGLPRVANERSGVHDLAQAPVAMGRRLAGGPAGGDLYPQQAAPLARRPFHAARVELTAAASSRSDEKVAVGKPSSVSFQLCARY